MAWHRVSQAQALTGKSRRTLYRDMGAGRASWRNDADGRRELETTELLRACTANCSLMVRMRGTLFKRT